MAVLDGSEEEAVLDGSERLLKGKDWVPAPLKVLGQNRSMGRWFDRQYDRLFDHFV